MMIFPDTVNEKVFMEIYPEFSMPITFSRVLGNSGKFFWCCTSLDLLHLEEAELNIEHDDTVIFI